MFFGYVCGLDLLALMIFVLGSFWMVGCICAVGFQMRVVERRTFGFQFSSPQLTFSHVSKTVLRFVSCMRLVYKRFFMTFSLVPCSEG